MDDSPGWRSRAQPPASRKTLHAAAEEMRVERETRVGTVARVEFAQEDTDPDALAHEHSGRHCKTV